MMKSLPNDLALFGGPKAFPEPLHVGRPNIGNRDVLHERLDDILDRRWLSNNGKYVQLLESELQKRLGVRHAIAVTNATIGLEVLARALDLKGEVIVPAFSFVASAHAFRWMGLTPVFVDVLPGCHTVDPTKIESLITDQTSAIVPVNLWGNVCNIRQIEDLAARYDLKVIIDSAHAFGCGSSSGLVGGNGNAEVFSFHATKFINAFEGGAITTNDDELARKVRLMINFGFAGFDNVQSIGTNGKMSEMCAAMAVTNLESIDEIVQRNHDNYFAYHVSLSGIPGIRLLQYDSAALNNYQYVVLEVDHEAYGASRDSLLEALQAEGVLARRYFSPGIHNFEPYISEILEPFDHLPVTNTLSQRVLVLPTGTSVNSTAIQTIASIVRVFARSLRGAGSLGVVEVATETLV